jgi:hypothetical protein
LVRFLPESAADEAGDEEADEAGGVGEVAQHEVRHNGVLVLDVSGEDGVAGGVDGEHHGARHPTQTHHDRQQWNVQQKRPRIEFFTTDLKKGFA